MYIWEFDYIVENEDGSKELMGTIWRESKYKGLNVGFFLSVLNEIEEMLDTYIGVKIVKAQNKYI